MPANPRDLTISAQEDTQVATKPSDHDVALELLGIMVSPRLKMEVGNAVADRALLTAYEEQGGNRADIARGLKYAVDQEWLRFGDGVGESSETLYLTDAGFAAA